MWTGEVFCNIGNERESREQSAKILRCGPSFTGNDGELVVESKEHSITNIIAR